MIRFYKDSNNKNNNNILDDLFPDSCHLKAKTKGAQIKCCRYHEHCGLTQFSAYCVIRGGSKVPRSIPPSFPL